MKKAELVFVPAPGVGHLVATLEFAKRLIDRGFLPFTSFVDAYSKLNTASRSGIRLIDLPEVEPPSPELLKESAEFYFTLFIESQLHYVRNIVSDIVSSRSCSESVRVTGLNSVCLLIYSLTSNAGFLGLMLYLPTRHDQISTVFESSDSELLIPGFVNPVPVFVLPSALFNKYGYSSYIKLAQRFNNVNGIIVNTLSELEPYAVNSISSSLNPLVYTVGPVLELKVPKKILKWLDDQSESSVVFLCFGSGGSFGPAQVKEIATGLEQNENEFLWSLRVSPPNNEVPLLDYITDDDVLAHKAIGGFVSHCGWNSILESLWYGVPIVTWPLYAEQQFNAFRMVKELRLAVEVRLDSRRDSDLVVADEIGRAVRCVVDGDSDQIKKKVKEMAEISRKSLMDGGSSFVSIGQFIDLNF
ncbi:hypothetical protein ACOSQ2_025346 [Xanthoceras sorbifolium]